MEGNREDGDRCFSMVTGDRTRSNGHTLKYKKFHSNISKSLFTVTVVKHQHRLSSKVLECLSVDMFKIQLDTVPDSLL